MAPLPSFKRPLPLDVPEAEPLTTDFVDIGDSYESLASLFDLPRNSPTRILEGELLFADAGATFRAQKVGSPKPTDSAPGITAGVDSSRTFGPNSPWRLDALWVKETVANAGAKAIFVGWVA